MVSNVDRCAGARMLGRPMAQRPFPFDAVLFDLDGTLVATDRFWVAAADRGARRAFEELGLERELPRPDEWMGLVGLPIREAFRQLFGDLGPAARTLVLERCLEAEREALADGGAELLPGAREVLERLRVDGVQLAIASNCGAPYLGTMLPLLGLDRLVDEARCLDSPGTPSKGAMIADLLRAFGTRSAVMVGDRHTDAEAAHANGLPHVHLADGFARPGETFACEAVVPSLGHLLPRLERRSEWIEEILEHLGLFSAARHPRSIGVTGRPRAGKTLFARDAARLLRARGVPVSVVGLDGVRDLLNAVLLPHARGEPCAGPDGVPIPPEACLIVEGGALLDPPVRIHLDALLLLEASEETVLRRGGPAGGSEPAFGGRADLVVPSDNPLGPLPQGAG